MIAQLLNHEWKSFWRSKNSGKSLGIKIAMGFLILYLFLNVVFVAFFLDVILEKSFPNAELLTSFNRLLLYYFLFDLLARFQMQELPTLSVQPYLTLPLRKRQLVNYLCITSLPSGFNFASIVLVLPFLLKVVLPNQGSMVFWALLLSVFGLTMFNHFFTIWIKRKSGLNGWYLLGFLVVIIALCLMDFKWNLIAISSLSSWLFGLIVLHPAVAFLPLLLALVMFEFNRRFLRNNLYLDELTSGKPSHRSDLELSFLNRFGTAGELAMTELKLIFRNKRPKTAVRMCLIMMFYGLLFYANPAYGNGYGWKLFAAQFMTGIFIISYGQFMFSWQSSHFDRILSLSINPIDFFKSKYILFTLFSAIAFVLTIPYVYFGWDILLVQACMFLWNLGVNTLIILLFANYNKRRIDLSKGASFNWEGVGATQMLVGFPLFLCPYIIYGPTSLMGHPLAGILILGCVGLLFVFTRSVWVKLLADKFVAKRYEIAEGFRHQ